MNAREKLDLLAEIAEKFSEKARALYALETDQEEKEMQSKSLAQYQTTWFLDKKKIESKIDEMTQQIEQKLKALPDHVLRETKYFRDLPPSLVQDVINSTEQICNDPASSPIWIGKVTNKNLSFLRERNNLMRECKAVIEKIYLIDFDLNKTTQYRKEILACEHDEIHNNDWLKDQLKTLQETYEKKLPNRDKNQEMQVSNNQKWSFSKNTSSFQPSVASPIGFRSLSLKKDNK